MATSQSKTRKQIRHSIGLNTETVWMDAGSIESSPSESAPSANKIIDQNLEFGSDDEHRGKWVFATDSNSSTELRRVRSSSPTERSLTVSVPFSRAPDTSWVYELWDARMSPTLVHDFADQSMVEATRKGSVPLTSDSFHTGGSINTWSLSSAIAGIRFVEWRNRFVGKQILSFDTAIDAGSNSSVSTSSGDFREGSAANRVVVATAASTNETIASSSFAQINIEKYTDFELWAKSNATVTSSAFSVSFFGDGGMNSRRYPLPALNGDSWTRIDLNLIADANLTNGEVRELEKVTFSTGSSDAGAVTLKLDDLTMYREKAEEWTTIPRNFWRIDKDRRELRIDPDADIPYAKLQITGVQKPALFTTDSAVSEIDPNYVINSATAKAFRVMGEAGMSDRFEALAQQQRVRMNTPSGIVWVDD